MSVLSEAQTPATTPEGFAVASSQPVSKVKDSHQYLQDLTSQTLGKQRLLIVSNRGPVTFDYSDGNPNQMIAKRGSGGVVTALSSLTNYTPVTWVAAALSEADREIARCEDNEIPCPDFDPGSNLRLRFVNIDEDSFEKYLNVISNPLLWFVQHEMEDLLEDTLNRRKIGEAWREGYVAANQAFAKAVADEAAKSDTAPFVIFHDYQLYLAPALVRQTRPDLHLMHFTHIPWPEPKTWHKLPIQLVQSICTSLLACDIIGFQTTSAVQAFVHTCQEFVADIEVQAANDGSYTLNHNAFHSQVRAYPISVDPAQVRQVYNSEQTVQWREQLLETLGKHEHQLIVRVDRLDPNKNVVGGFEAYETLLETQPELHDKVLFLALLVPTRESVAEYANYKEQTFELIDHINRRFGDKEWQPIHYIYGNDYARALAALSLADVVLVNSVADGMNLVAKEAIIVGENKGVLVLSRNTGAWEELGEAALGVEPEDIPGTAQALTEALAMSAAERSQRATRLLHIIEENDLTSWLAAHLHDLAQVQQNKALSNLRAAQTTYSE